MIEIFIMVICATIGAYTSYKSDSILAAYQTYFSEDRLIEHGFSQIKTRYFIFSNIIFYSHILLGVIGIIFNFKYVIAYAIGLLLCDVFWNLKTFDLTVKEIRKMEALLDLKAIIIKTLEILSKQKKDKN